MHNIQYVIGCVTQRLLMLREHFVACSQHACKSLCSCRKQAMQLYVYHLMSASFCVQTFDIPPETCLRVSAKTGLGLETVLPAVIEQVPCPTGNPDGPLRMLLFDAFHDEYRCVP